MHLLLPLDAYETYVLLDALNALPIDDDLHGTIAQDIADRVRELQPLVTSDATQLLRTMGIGSYKGRRQG